MFLTGNADIDNTLLLSLDYQDMTRLCQTTLYANHLCANNVDLQRKIKTARQRANRIVGLNRKRYTLMFLYEDQIFEPIHAIVNDMNVVEFHHRNLNYYNYDVIQDINMRKKELGYLVYIETDDGNEVAFQMTIKNVTHFLFVLFYNQLLVIY